MSKRPINIGENPITKSATTIKSLLTTTINISNNITEVCKNISENYNWWSSEWWHIPLVNFYFFNFIYKRIKRL